MSEKLLTAVRGATKNNEAAFIKTMTECLRYGADINARAPEMQPVLHTLCALGFGSAVSFAMENGASLYGGTDSALSTAAMHVNLEAVRLLIPREASPTGSVLGYSNAIYALMKNLPKDNDPSPRPGMKADALECLQILMAAGGELSRHSQSDIINRFNYLVPAQPHLQPAIDLLKAHLAEGTAALERVLANGVHPDLIARYGSAAPLAWAMTHGDMERMKLLVSHGADPDLYGVGLPSPVHQALSRGHMDAMVLMLEKGATGIAHDLIGKPVKGEKDMHELATLYPGPVADYAISVLDAQEKKKMDTVLKTMAIQRPMAVQKKPVAFKPRTILSL